VTVRIAIAWRPRAEPLAATALVAEAAAAASLRARLLAMTDPELAALRGAAGGDALCLLGDAAALPWVDGVEYLGQDLLAPSLLLPTAWEPTCHAALLARAWSRNADEPAPWAVLRRSRRLLSVAAARPIARARLAAWEIPAGEPPDGRGSGSRTTVRGGDA
jgi:hypothetical protein